MASLMRAAPVLNTLRTCLLNIRTKNHFCPVAVLEAHLASKSASMGSLAKVKI